MRTAKELFAELNSFDENRRIEAKSASAVGKSMMETVCAFANEPGLCGGYLLLGAKRTGMAEDGSPVYEPENIENTDKVQSDFVVMCNSMFNVRIRPIINVEEYLGKTVIVVKIEELPESQKPAYFAKRGLPEGAFRRIGPSDEKCSEEDMYLFYQSADTYDSCIVDDADLDDIDENALNFYRKLRKEVNPDAEELTLNDVDLLRALGAIKKNKQGGYDLTYTGLLVFGKQMSLRRLVPSFRVDYIRISGNQWLADGDNRFEQTIDMRGPLILMVNKACSAVMDDLPKGFELKKDSMQASTPAILPNKVLREAIVNSYIHRSNRVNQPIQIIRYSNRIEIHNPGYSLKPQDDWGEPGSMLRNPRISEIFHDTNLAETKGTGIGAMRRLMKEAGLMPPTFESNHEANKFTARLLLHHFLSKENMEWLAQYAEFDLVNEQKLALVFVREVGAIDNATYRQLDSSITHARARLEIHKLCDLGFLEKKGQGRNTYYIRTSKVVSLGERLRPQDEKIPPQHGTLGEKIPPQHGTLGKKIPPQGEKIPPQHGTFEIESQPKSRNELLRELPKGLQERVAKLGKWASREKVSQLLVDLCAFKPYSYEELALIIQRAAKPMKDKYIKPLRLANKLFYWIPEMINHPLQKYVADPSMARSSNKKRKQ
ncbi:putative DNA binding domain-containing protein [Prevotella copri]|uniref:AAA family ATPase n=1 Tax=Segatella copri TaxID=165179 RepID=A0AA91A895_9BACT|nr:ATP-binding protein [Segatella copri]MBV3444850.1 putative DNA binding domain-containing protein [Segatella copri]MQO92430.1 AAA family ATPase [Segatella copri]